uniref:Uncharacterized protein n=1 Tax=Panagrolaimus sp. PS1159 TaxID=55785 RepID=A0AC35FKD5_9BILA
MNHAVRMINIPDELYRRLLDNQKDKNNDLSVKEDHIDVFNKNRVLSHKQKLRQKIQNEVENIPQKVQVVSEVLPSEVDSNKIIKEEKREKQETFVEKDISVLDKFIDKLIDKRYIYGVTENAQVLNSEGKAVKSSNIKTIVEYLINPNNFTKAPAGTKWLRQRIEPDLDFQHLKETYKEKPVTDVLPNQSGTNKYARKLFTLWT